MPERSDDAFARSESVKHARAAAQVQAVRACCCFFARPPKRERLKRRNIACVRKSLGVLLCRSQADHPTAPFEHDKRDSQAENILFAKRKATSCIMSCKYALKNASDAQLTETVWYL